MESSLVVLTWTGGVRLDNISPIPFQTEQEINSREKQKQ